MTDTAQYLKVLELYHRDDNALFVPETSGGAAAARFFFSAFGLQAIGFAPFGLDHTRTRTSKPALPGRRRKIRRKIPFVINLGLWAVAADGAVNIRPIIRSRISAGGIHGLRKLATFCSLFGLSVNSAPIDTPGTVLNRSGDRLARKGV